MRIEVELLKIDQDTDKARACAVALLSALPQDEAHQAVAEWRAVCMARAEDANAPLNEMEQAEVAACEYRPEHARPATTAEVMASAARGAMR